MTSPIEWKELNRVVASNITYSDIFLEFKKKQPHVQPIDYRPQGAMGILVYTKNGQIIFAMLDNNNKLRIYKEEK